VGVGRADGVAVPGLAVDRAAGVTVHGVVADEHDRAVRDDVVEQEPGEGGPELDAGPRGSGQDPVVAGRVAGGEVADGAEEVGDGPPAGRQDGGHQEGREPVERRGGEGREEGQRHGAGFGW